MRSSCTRATMAPMSMDCRAVPWARSVPCGRGPWRSAARLCSLLHEQAGTGAADLSLIEPDAIDQALDRAVEVGVLKMMKGDLPPSSSESRLWLEAVALRMARPTSVDPVNAILATSGCFTNASPVEPSPVTMLTTPGGSAISEQISAKASAVSGVNSAGLSTTVLPVARAGAIFQASISNGKFQGMICPTTPHAVYPGNS